MLAGEYIGVGLSIDISDSFPENNNAFFALTIIASNLNFYRDSPCLFEFERNFLLFSICQLFVILQQEEGSDYWPKMLTYCLCFYFRWTSSASGYCHGDEMLVIFWWVMHMRHNINSLYN